MLSFCGIDMSKDRLDVIVLPEEQRSSVSNDQTGWADLVERLRGSASRRAAVAKRQSPQRAALLVKGGGTAWFDGNVSSRSRPVYNHAVDRSRESGTFSVLG